MKLKILAVVAIIGFLFALNFVISGAKKDPINEPVREPAEKPYKSSIAGVGIIESFQENINIKPYWQGKVVKILVKEGEKVKTGAPLFELDSSQLKAQLKSIQAQAESTKALINKLQNEPRKEDIPPQKAAVKAAKADYENIKSQLEKMENVTDKRALSKDLIDTTKFKVEAAKAKLDLQQAQLKKLLAGAWKYDIEQKKAEYSSLLAKAKEIQVLIDQAVIRAPKNSEILKIYTRVGEYISFMDNDPPLKLGATKRLQVRIDIDEIDASNVRPDMQGTAFLKGDATKKFRITYDHIQPFMVPKKNLSGYTQERVDVRVLQLIYSFDPPDFPVYVGQQVDIFLDNTKRG